MDTAFNLGAAHRTRTGHRFRSFKKGELMATQSNLPWLMRSDCNVSLKYLKVVADDACELSLRTQSGRTVYSGHFSKGVTSVLLPDHTYVVAEDDDSKDTAYEWRLMKCKKGQVIVLLGTE